MKKIFLLLICMGAFSFNTYAQSKLLNAVKGTKVAGNVETQESKTKPPVKKKMPSMTKVKDLDSKYASTGYMEITGISFGNTDNAGSIIDDYGADMYASEIKYLTPKVFYKGLSNTDKNITLYVRILKDDSSVMSGKTSPEGYTFKDDVKVECGNGKSFALSGWGNNNNGKAYSAGQYKYEIWYKGNILFQKGFRLYSGSTPLASSRLIKINNIEFINADNSGNVIAPARTSLYAGEVQYLKPQMRYNGLYAGDQKVFLMVRIFEPSGNLSTGKGSPLGFTYKSEIVIKPGNNATAILAWGNSSGTYYKEGVYKYEVWLDGEKIYETTFNIQKGNSNSSSYADNGQKIETTQIVDLGLSSKTKWAGWNVGAVSPEDYGGYYAWGETISKHPYTWGSYFDIENKSPLIFKKYSSNGVRSIVGTSNDVAKVLWGNDWRMPTKKQIDELLRDCQWTWTSYRGRKGFAVKGPNGKCIFFPASGSYFISNKNGTEILNRDDTCYYWCGELDKNGIFKSSRAYCLILSDGYSKYYDRNGERCDGKSVRAVYVGL